MHYKRFAKAPVFSHNELLVTITLFSKTIKTAMWYVFSTTRDAVLIVQAETRSDRDVRRGDEAAR